MQRNNRSISGDKYPCFFLEVSMLRDYSQEVGVVVILYLGLFLIKTSMVILLE